MNDHPTSFAWRSEFDRLEGAYAPATMRAYYSDVQAFVDWCEAHSHQAFPAATTTVCQFLEDQGRKLSTSTVRRRLYAVRKIHRLLRMADPTQDEDINLSLRRVKRSKFSRPKQARGITAQDLEKFISTEPDTPIGLRNKAMLALGYELLARRSELVAIRLDDLTFRSDGTLRVLIRRSKMDPYGLGRVGYTSIATAQKITQWLKWRDNEIAWLFCPIYKDKPINRHLSDTSVKRLIKNAALRTGYPPKIARQYTGHSLRVGAAQELLTRGFDTASIMRAGGWKSLNILSRYIENTSHNVWM